MTKNPAEASSAERRPNLVFILTDQQRIDTIRALGNPHMVTPHMDRLVEGGVSFRRAYCPGATCTPSRAAIFTGMYAHNTGCYTFRDWGHHRTWVEDLRDAGYWCVNIGKMHFQPRDVSGGFHERVVVENPTGDTSWGGNGDDAWGKYLSFHGAKRPLHRNRTDPDWEKKYQCVPWHMEEHLHSDVFVGSSAVSWLKSYAPKHEPFFLQVGFPGPHEPWDPPARLLEHYPDGVGPDPIAPQEDLSGKPPQHQALKKFFSNSGAEGRINMEKVTDADLRNMRRHYYAKTTLVDEQIGRVLAALEEGGHLENSIVVLSSDHGEMLGDHGLAYKWLMYESIVNVPLVISTPETRREGARGVEDLVSLMDVGPTLLECAGVPVPSRLEGQSLLPAMNGQPYASRTHVYCEDNYLVMCRSENAKMVYYLGQAEGELYDLKSDPQELRNLWDDPESAALKQEMKERILDWMSSSCYHNWGYKSRAADAAGQYPVRWPNPALEDYQVQAQNFRERLVPHH